MDKEDFIERELNADLTRQEEIECYFWDKFAWVGAWKVEEIYFSRRGIKIGDKVTAFCSKNSKERWL